MRRGNIRLGVAATTALVGVLAAMPRPSASEERRSAPPVVMSPEEEMALGLTAAPAAAARAGGALPATSAPAARATRLVARLAAQPDAHATPYRFTVHVLDADAPASFALPGGEIFVTRGLVARLADDAALAMVLGHEMGHVVARHAAEALAPRADGAALVRAIAAPDADPARLADRALDLLERTPLARGAEAEADALGARLAAGGGHDLAAAPAALAATQAMPPLARALHGPAIPLRVRAARIASLGKVLEGKK